MANINNVKYDKKYIGEVDKYLKSRKDRKYLGALKVKLPTYEGFAISIGVCEKTVRNWAKKKGRKHFRAALARIKYEQKERLFNMGLSGDYNPTIAKLILMNNHKMKERSDATTDDEPITNFNDKQIDRIAERIARRRDRNGDTPSAEKSN